MGSIEAKSGSTYVKHTITVKTHHIHQSLCIYIKYERITGTFYVRNINLLLCCGKCCFPYRFKWDHGTFFVENSAVSLDVFSLHTEHCEDCYYQLFGHSLHPQ